MASFLIKGKFRNSKGDEWTLDAVLLNAVWEDSDGVCHMALMDNQADPELIACDFAASINANLLSVDEHSEVVPQSGVERKGIHMVLEGRWVDSTFAQRMVNAGGGRPQHTAWRSFRWIVDSGDFDFVPGNRKEQGNE